MAVYLSDGDLYGGWKSAGRRCALFGAAALACAVLGFSLTHGHPVHLRALSDHMLAVAALWVGGGLFVILAAAAWGSILISLSEQGGVEVTSEGVRRIFKPGREEFLPRRQIAGLVPRPQGGVILIDSANSHRMVIPRSIEGYRDCIGELKAMGIERLPATAQNLGWASRKLTRFERIQMFLACITASFYFNHRIQGPPHYVAGLALLALILFNVILGGRKTRQVRWGDWLFVVAAVAALAWRW